jgi:alpha-beta hydrolase superfamily lysophospholipase
VVAPEALSRFYVDRGEPAAGTPARVGATWMTREDRDAEIADYLGYLDQALEAATAAVPGGAPGGGGAGVAALGVLGFSQGAATACRWAAHRRRRGLPAPDALVLWGGALPHDLDLAGADGGALRALRLTLVVGDADEFATPALLAEQEPGWRRRAWRTRPCGTRAATGWRATCWGACWPRRRPRAPNARPSAPPVRP